MSIKNSFLTKNPCYKAGKQITVRGLMLHSVGCPQPNPQVFIKNWNRESYSTSCVHGFIGEEDVFITLPCFETPTIGMRGWHCGGAANNTHLGFEMCEPSQIKYTGGSSFICSDYDKAITFANKTIELTVDLFAKLCKFHNLNPLEDGVIISHAEGHKRKVATNHGDPEHLWKQLGIKYSMEQFRRDVYKKLNEI